MAGHILDVELPEASPMGAPGGDYQDIHTSPAMFGGYTAEGLKQAGQGLERASNAGFQVLSERQTLQNSIHSADLNSWYADQVTDKWSKFSQLQGKAALDALPQFKKDIEDLRVQALSKAPSLQEQSKLATSLRYLQDSYYRYGANHADQQFHTWETNTAKNGIASYAGQAAVAYQNGDMDGFNRFLTWQDNEVRNLSSKTGDDPEAEVLKRRGITIEQIIKNQVNTGNLQKANDLYAQYKDKIDPASSAAISAALKHENTQVDAIRRVNKDFTPPQPVTQPALDYIGNRYGVSGSYLARTHQLEGNGTSPTGAKGPFQFTDSTAAKYGLTNPFDFTASADAAARLAADNKASLTGSLGRQPTDAELYLAHQQGAKGAAALIANPNMPAADALASAYGGDRAKAANAIAVNGGNPNAPASAFVQMWTNKFNGQSGNVTVQDAANYYQRTKGDAINKILTDPDLIENPTLRNAMIQEVNRRWTVESAKFTDEQRSWQQQERAAKEAEKQGTDDLLNGLINNDPSWTAERIMADPRFAYNREHALSLLQAKVAGQKDVGTYGAGFYDLFKKVHAPDGDPNKITDESVLYDHVGRDLTLSGLQALRGEISSKKTPQGEADAAMKAEFLKTAHSQISGRNELLHIKDPKGEEQYLKFLAAFFPAYQKAINEGKSPAVLFNPESPDYLGKSIPSFKRSPAQMNADLLSANSLSGSTQTPVDTSTAQGLIRAVHEGKMTRAEGEKVALERGWIRANPPQQPEVTVPMSR